MSHLAVLALPRALLDAVVAHARAEWPNECCGVLAGTTGEGVGTVAQHFVVRNELASPTEYEANARDLLAASKASRAAGTEWLALYHSHPTSAPVPSRKDLACNTYGETVMHLIVGLSCDPPEVCAWWLGQTAFREAELRVFV